MLGGALAAVGRGVRNICLQLSRDPSQASAIGRVRLRHQSYGLPYVPAAQANGVS
jgi:hypothetical protein